MDNGRRDRIAQWAFDTRAMLGRFHLWLEDVDLRYVQGGESAEHSFTGEALERGFIVCAAVTALGTRLFGRYGEGKGLRKAELNRVKKDADALSAYALSEGLWYLTRHLPENHAVMVSLGEGLMPKAGETPEMGSNPQLGFGRVYARPQVAKFLDRCVNRLLNDTGYEWQEFWEEVRTAGITVWGAAIDTLENTSRFANGAETGPLTVLHLFDQPLEISRPYEGYMGTLVLPEKVVLEAEDRSRLINFTTPRKRVLDAIRLSYPGIRPEHVHVWTLGGPARSVRLGSLWEEWSDLGVHLVPDGWTLPNGGEAFTESGTYAPSFQVGTSEDEAGDTHLFIVDGYAASAEAIQAASLDPVLSTRTSLSVFSSRFEAGMDRERNVMRLDPEADDFAVRLRDALEAEVDAPKVEIYREIIRNALEAGMPLTRPTSTVDDFFPNKRWDVLAVAGAMLPDPYTGTPGVMEVGPDTYQVTTIAATRNGILEATLTLRLMESGEKAHLFFSPLLDRFYAGADYRSRAVKISDSGRIRNELQTLVSEALEHFGEGGIRVHFDRIDDAVLPPDKKELIREVLEWYQRNHPAWFRWLELA